MKYKFWTLSQSFRINKLTTSYVNLWWIFVTCSSSDTTVQIHIKVNEISKMYKYTQNVKIYRIPVYIYKICINTRYIFLIKCNVTNVKVRVHLSVQLSRVALYSISHKWTLPSVYPILQSMILRNKSIT